MRISRRKGLLLAGIALIGLSLLLITSSPFQQWLLRKAERYAADAGFPFTAERLRLDFTDLRASVDGITYDQKGQLIRVERLAIDLPWNALRGDDLHFTNIEADGVVVNIQSSEPSPSSGKSSTASAGKKPPRIRIDRLAIRNGSLTYSTPTSTVKVPSFSLEATDGRGSIRLDEPVSIGTESNIAAGPIPVVIDNESAQFGPTPWRIHNAKYDGSGTARGNVRWSPAVTLETEVSTDPLTIEKWKDILLTAKASYADGTFDIPEFRATQGGGEIAGTGRISDSGTSTTIRWKDVNLDPSGLVGRTDGTLNLKWKRSDFGDLSGDGHVNLTSRQYGAYQTEIRITEAKAALDVRANARDLAIRGQVAAGLEPLLAGTLNGIQGTVRGSLRPLPSSPLYQRVEVVSVSAAAMFRDNTLTVRTIRATSKGSSVSGGTLQANLASRRIRGSIPEVLVDLHDFAPNAMGSVSLSADIAGSFDQPTASFTGSSSGLDVGSAHIDNITLAGEYADGLRGMFGGTLHPFAPGAPYPGLSAIDVTAMATLRDNVLAIQDLNARAKASRVSDASLEVNLTDKQIRGNAPTIQIDLSDFSTETLGVVNLAADIGGTIDQPTALFAGSSARLDIAGTPIDTVSLEGRFENDTVVLTQLEARQADGVLGATGRLNLATEAISADARISDLKIAQVMDLSTTALLDAHAEGTYSAPNINFSGELRDVVYRQENHGTVQIQGSTNLKTATVQAKSEKYSAAVTGDITLQQPYPFAAALTATQSQLHYGEYEMVADGRVRVSGEAQPFKADKVEFEALKLRGEGITLTADGTTLTGSALDVRVNLADLPIEGVDLGGTAHVSATVSGNLNDPSIEGTLTTDNATARVMQMNEPADITARVDFTGKDISIRTLQANYAGATATVTGNGLWNGSGNLQFRVANVRPENFLPGQPVSGIANAEGELDIKSPRLEDISGYLKFTELAMTVRGVAVHQLQPIEVALDNQIVTVRSLEIEGLDTHASIKGQANLRDRSLNLDADADTDLVILEPFIPNSHPSGRIETRVALRGTADKPNLDGFLRISDADLVIETPNIELSAVNVEAQFRNDRIELSRANGMLNEGTFEASGGTGLSAAGLRDASFKVNVQRAQLEYPEGLQSEFSSQLALEGTMPNMTLRGTVTVLNAAYQKDFKLTQALFAQITAPPPPPISTRASEGVSNQIRMEVEVQTENPVLVKNNVADLEASGTFQIRGTVANPVILGRALVSDGGELYFGPAVSSQAVETVQRSDRYAIERGSIDFNNPLRSEPDLDFRATHELEVEDERYIVTLEVTGTPETLKAELTSDPYLDQQDIVTMLLTGRKLEDLQGTYASVAGEQALSYVSGQLSEKVLSQAGNALGLNTVRIDPIMVANQTDVAARLTIAKDVTADFSLVYSQNLNDTKAQTWIASYEPFRRFVMRGINDGEQNEILVDLKHELRLGGGAALLERTRPQNEVRLRKITFTGTSFSEKDLRKRVTKEGSPFGTYHSSQDVRNLRRFLASQGYPSARIQAQQNTEGRNVDVQFEITQGPKIVFGYEGAEVPESLRKEIEQVWTLRSSDAASVRESIRRLLRHFRSEGYLEAQISSENPPPNAAERRYVFKIVPGIKFDKPAWVFHGIEPMSLQDPAGVVMEKPEAMKELIEGSWRDQGYLDVTSTEPLLVIEGAMAHFEVTVVRGQAYVIQSIEFEGNHALDAQHLREIITTEVSKTASKKEKTPAHFTSEWLEAARRSITSEYWKRGYNEVQIVPSTKSDSGMARTDVLFTILEGELQIIERIEVTGAMVTNRRFIERQFEFKKGDPVDLTRLNLTRKKLYDTRLFKRVETEVARGTNGYVVRIRLTENAPWQVRYGLAVTEHLDNGNRSVGVSADLAYNNLLGRAITTGFSGKLDSDEKDGRVFASSPQLFGRRVTTSLTFFRTQDTADPEDVVDYWGTTAQQQWRLGQHYLISYDYSYRKVLSGGITDRQLEEGEDILDDVRVPIARFGIVLSRDTRDDILDATRGTFISNSFEIAPPGIGSSVEFLRNFSQFFYYKPVKKLVLSSAFRFGAARSIEDQELDPTLQYKSGGGTTVRAFKQDELTRVPGNYELVLNQEVRFPLVWKFSGVAFVDAGQITNAMDNIFNLRWGPGLGIRIHTPFVLLRVDLGINVNRRPGEDQGRWSFGIGQAF